MAEGSFNFDTHFSSSSVASAVSTGCGASKNHDLYSQASSTGTTVLYMTTDSDVYITHEDQTLSLINRDMQRHNQLLVRRGLTLA